MMSDREVLLDVEGLNVGFDTAHGFRHVVKDFGFTLHRGETIAIVGESGSGKTVATRALIGLAGDQAQVEAKTLRVNGLDVLSANESQLRTVRGAHVGYVLQDALVSLDPLRPIRAELAEAINAHGRQPKHDVESRSLRLLTEVGIPNPEIRMDQLPRELSGGMRQRGLIATALVENPPVIIADEPTTALDVLVQAQVLGVLEKLIREGTSLILISHDLAVVAQLANRVLVMKGGEIVESGDVEVVLRSPKHPYTQALIQAIPGGHTRGQRLSAGVPAPASSATQVRTLDVEQAILDVSNVRKTFPQPDGQRLVAVDDVSFSLIAGEVLGIVGQSGSGKSTLARLILALEEADQGDVLYRGLEWTRADAKTKRRVRSKISVVYQDPYSSFDPRWTVGRILRDAIDLHSDQGRVDRAEIIELLEAVGLSAEHLDARPLYLSGGQRQRVAIARALAVNPEILILDEAVSALDVSIQAQILDLLTDLKDRFALSVIFISHDLGVIHHISDRVIVLKDGKIVEEGKADAIFYSPTHQYTQELVCALPKL